MLKCIYGNNIEIVSALTGEDGVEVFGENLLNNKNNFDYIFVDIDMPGINGFETIK